MLPTGWDIAAWAGCPFTADAPSWLAEAEREGGWPADGAWLAPAEGQGEGT